MSHSPSPESTPGQASDDADAKPPKRRKAARTPRKSGAAKPSASSRRLRSPAASRSKPAAKDVAAPLPARPVRQPRLSADDTRIRDFAVETARLLHDSHCENVLVFDLRGLSDMTDYILIASGTSDRQIRSVGEDVEELAEKSGLRRFGRDEDGRATWIVLDFVDAVVHLFEPVARAHYDLEMMWGDAPRVRWQRRAGGTGKETPAADEAGA